MAITKLYYADRAKSVSTSTGTGDMTMTAATGPWVPISYNDMGPVKDVHYCIVHLNGTEWEVGRGQVLAGDILQRNGVYSSSVGSGSLTNFSAGEKEVSLVLSANIIKRIYAVAEDGGIPATSPSRTVTTTNEGPIGIDYSVIEGGVREFIVCARSATGGNKSKVWRVTATYYAGAVQKTVAVISESEALAWSVDFKDSGMDINYLYVTGAAATTIDWYVHERILGRFA